MATPRNPSPPTLDDLDSMPVSGDAVPLWARDAARAAATPPAAPAPPPVAMRDPRDDDDRHMHQEAPSAPAAVAVREPAAVTPAPVRESALARAGASLPEAERDRVRQILASMVAGGWAPGEGGSRAATDQERWVVAQLCAREGLDPLAGHLFLLGGRPYVSAAGLRAIAAQRQTVAGIVTRPATAQERADAMCPDGCHYWIADVYLHGESVPTRGHGFADANNVKVARGDWRIVANTAETRATARALRAALSVSLGDAEDAGAWPEPPTTPARSLAAAIVDHSAPPKQIGGES